MFDAIHPLEVVLRLVDEAVKTRVFHRAMIETLMNGPFDWEEYKRHVFAIGNRDFDALQARLMISENDFQEVFAEWSREDHVRYALTPPSNSTNSTAKTPRRGAKRK